MKTPRDIPSWAYAVAVVLTTVAYGASYVVIKDAMEAVATSWLLAMRFGLAALVLGVAFRRRIARTIDLSHMLAGVVVGLPEALGFLLQNLGLTQTSPGRNAFLTATYCVMVPFLAWAVERRRPGANNVVAAVMCLTGVGLLSLTGRQSLSLGAGDWLTLFSALMYASNMVAVGRLGRAHDAVCLTFLMLVTCALVCMGWAVALEPAPLASAFTAEFAAQLAYITIATTVVGLLVQNVAQRHLPSSEVALLLSFESVFAAVFSVAFYGEKITPSLLAGFALIFGAVLVSQFAPGRRQADELRAEARGGRP